MKIIVTGTAGFIGNALALRLLQRGDEVSGIDNHNDYYDPALKDARLARLEGYDGYRHYRADLADETAVMAVFKACRPKVVVNLAAQAGVRYSIENPLAYVRSNITGFAHVLEGCRHYGVEHLVYASSSSVYGGNATIPHGTGQNVDHPLSLYAASKKSNELMAHAYSHLYDLPTTGLRFFTVYGPWGRPDMAYYGFTKSIIEGTPIKVFNHGDHRRDFTYIDDIIEGLLRVLDRPAQADPDWSNLHPSPHRSSAPWRIYNIGNNKPVELLDFIAILERKIGREAVKEMLPAQPGDVHQTYADIDDLAREFNYRPSTAVADGLSRFVDWYRAYYEV